MGIDKDLKDKYKQLGIENLSEEEKLRLLLSYSGKDEDSGYAAGMMMEHYGSLRAVFDSDPLMLMKEYDISEQSAVLIGLIPVLSRICAMDACRDVKLVSTDNACDFFSAFLRSSRREMSVIAAVSRGFRVTRSAVLAYGDINNVTLSCRRAIEFAYLNEPKYIFVAHCHPTGGCSPSENDISATLKLREALDVLNISLADHIITSHGEAVSMRARVGCELFSDVSGYAIGNE